MASQVKALTPKSRQSKIDAKNQTVKQTPEKSPKGKRRKVAEGLREVVQAQRAKQKKNAVKALKEKHKPAAERESKTRFASDLFAGMTPRQVKRLKSVPQRMNQFLKSKESVAEVQPENIFVETE